MVTPKLNQGGENDEKGVEVNWHESQQVFRVSCKEIVDIFIL